MKTIKIICNECGHEFEEEVEYDYLFNYEDFTCPECETYENLFEDK